MQHVAIMKKSWKLIPKILSSQKTIESRWYQTRRAPWGKIAPGDIVYFKNSGELVTVEARVSKILQYKLEDRTQIKLILHKYGRRIGISAGSLPKFRKRFEDKRYCILVSLTNAKLVKKPFRIDRSGFGNAAAWLTAKKFRKIKELDRINV